MGDLVERVAELAERVLLCLPLPKTSPAQVMQLLVSMKDAAEAIASSDVEAGNLVRVSDRCGQRLQRVGASS